MPADRWFAMTRLDENRAKSQLAHKAGVRSRVVTNLAIWGNHSATQFPDFAHARIDGKPAPEVIGDDAWLRGPFIETVQKRGAAVIEARGVVVGRVGCARGDRLGEQRLADRHRPGDWHSLAVASRGEYGTPEGLQFGFPVRERRRRAGRSSRASSTTTSRPRRSASRPRSWSASATRSAASA